MATGASQQLDSFVDWIRDTDAHASHHLRLLGTVERALDAPAEIPLQDRRRLAEKVERWRYQHLNEHAGDLTARDDDLADALDLAAQRLACRGPGAPRRTRRALRDASLDTPAMDEALAALDPAHPLDRAIEWAKRLTREHFSVIQSPADRAPARRRMLLYAPLYVSSECVNYCAYCGFRFPRKIVRRQLTVEESLEEARVLLRRGFRHLLVVGGDFPSRTTTAYYAEVIAALVREGAEPGIEIAPQSTEAYAELAAAGICGLTLYQETYDQRLYGTYHERGPKSLYHWRLEAHDRAAEAGVPRLGLGVLLGLAHPGDELLALMRHAAYLTDRFPDRSLAFSLPRIHEAPEDFEIPHRVSDEQLIRLYCALRIAYPRAELVLSTREPRALRDRLARICVTQMSAGSSTAPGGYRRTDPEIGQQFPVADHRTPAEVADWLEREGFHVCWSVDSARTLIRR